MIITTRVLFGTLPRFGPLHRGQATTLFALPVGVTTPWITAFSASSGRTDHAGRAILASSVVVLVIVVGVLGTASGVIGCRPADALEKLIRASAVEIVASLGYGSSSFVALGQLRRGRRLRAWVGGSSMILLSGLIGSTAFILFYPAYSCAAP